ncbi:hypothetical protein ACFSNO_10450 [Streptomyces cirratus]
MNDVKSYVPAVPAGQADGRRGAVGEVVASAAEGIAVGDHVLHGLGWREYAELDAKHATKVDASLVAPLSTYLGVLGMPGPDRLCRSLRGRLLQGGRTPCFVSGAAGAVGSLVGQFAKIKGASG